MPAELRKRAAPPAAAAPPPKVKKAAPAKPKAGKKDAESAPAPVEDAPKATEPPASNPATDPKAGISEGAGGVSATADVTGADVAKEVAAKVEKAAVKGKGKGKGGKAAAPAPAPAVEPAPELAPEPAAAEEKEVEEEAKAETATGKVETGGRIALEGFGGEVQTHEGEKTTLAQLVAASKAGVVLFTYPKASTPGCTKQACLFRDAFTPLTATGLAIYGLSTDSPKSNATFKTKQSLPFTLLCDPSGSLIGAIGFKSGKSTARGVFVVGKKGEILAVEKGGPQVTVDAVTKIVEGMGGGGSGDVDVEMGGTAAEVADTAEKLDA
ncbi:thioredoxin peroxidase dot5 [Teratosphaeriaceae sp. CCFEE 6253]|nr:thioredoxin peroxidase dot5 [Teratosphaeriaceae sp. CCFEE 6253]